MQCTTLRMFTWFKTMQKLNIKRTSLTLYDNFSRMCMFDKFVSTNFKWNEMVSRILQYLSSQFWLLITRRFSKNIIQHPAKRVPSVIPTDSELSISIFLVSSAISLFYISAFELKLYFARSIHRKNLNPYVHLPLNIFVKLYYFIVYYIFFNWYGYNIFL